MGRGFTTGLASDTAGSERSNDLVTASDDNTLSFGSENGQEPLPRHTSSKSWGLGRYMGENSMQADLALDPELDQNRQLTQPYADLIATRVSLSSNECRSESTDSRDDTHSSAHSGARSTANGHSRILSPYSNSLAISEDVSKTSKAAEARQGLSAGFQDSLYIRQNPMGGYVVPRDQGIRNVSFEEQRMNVEPALTDDVDMPFGSLHADPQQAGVRLEHNWGLSPQALAKTISSMLQIHLDSSAHKLGLIHQSPLVLQFSVMTQTDVVDRGIAASVEILAGCKPSSALNLVCFVHLAYVLSLVVHAEVDAERSRELFSRSMSYSTWLEGYERQAYINMVDALWKPSNMALTDVVGLLQGAERPASLGGTSAAFRTGSSLESRSGDIIFDAFEDALDEFEHAVLLQPTDPELQASNLYNRHMKDLRVDAHHSQPFIVATALLLQGLSRQFSDVPGLVESIAEMISRVQNTRYVTARRIELEALRIGRSYLSPSRFLSQYGPLVRRQVDELYARIPDPDSQRNAYSRDAREAIRSLLKSVVRRTQAEGHPSSGTGIPSTADSMNEFLGAMTSNIGDISFHDGSMGSAPAYVATYSGLANSQGEGMLDSGMTTGRAASSSSAARSPPSPSGSYQASLGSEDPTSASKIESNTTCSLCGYRPKGDPRWFGGSMAKHMKLQHSTTPPKIYRCPYPGCTSQFQKRPDNLRQHQIEKSHFVNGQVDTAKRISKRKKL
ncbi:hypothetical protein CC79DRAFT_1398398 [Sarocladium strictum]